MPKFGLYIDGDFKGFFQRLEEAKARGLEGLLPNSLVVVESFNVTVPNMPVRSRKWRYDHEVEDWIESEI